MFFGALNPLYFWLYISAKENIANTSLSQVGLIEALLSRRVELAIKWLPLSFQSKHPPPSAFGK